METHTGNLGGLGWTGDLHDPGEFLEHLREWGIETVDLIAGGPPRQPFSRAGSAKIRSLVRAGERMADDPRASLWNSFMNVVEALGPKAVLVETSRFRPTRRLAGEPVLLLDDTWATGGHAQSAAYSLVVAGASKVALIVIGRHIRRGFQVTPDRLAGELLDDLPEAFDWDTCAVHASRRLGAAELAVD